MSSQKLTVCNQGRQLILGIWQPYCAARNLLQLVPEDRVPPHALDKQQVVHAAQTQHRLLPSLLSCGRSRAYRTV